MSRSIPDAYQASRFPRARREPHRPCRVRLALSGASLTFAIRPALALLLTLAAACSRQPAPPADLTQQPATHASWPAGVMEALEQAGDNRPELERVLGHYAAPGDSLELRAAIYLIEHMEGHSFVTIALVDTAGAPVDLEVLDYPDYDTLIAAADSIEAERGELSIERQETFPDLETIGADLLIEHIDLAFEAWRGLPWADHLVFDDFCAYVLPYRGSNEPLGSWRPHFMARYAAAADSLADATDPLEIARWINQDLRDWFGFDSRYYLHPTDQGLDEMLDTQLGRCEDMTNLAIFAMRANALAVTSDYTPHWADTGNNHAWNAILDRQGNVSVFMGAEADPGRYRLANRAAKVYRKTYARQPDNLAFRKEEWEKVPRWLGGKNYLDVTADYGPVANTTVELAQAIPDSTRLAYLCVFNSGDWRPIHWGWIESDRVTFDDMALDILYLPAYYVDGEVEPAAPAFILEAGGTRRLIAPRADATTTLRLRTTTHRKRLRDTDGIAEKPLESGREYQLFYWQERWVECGTSTATEEPLVFEQVPEAALYWLVADGSRRDERVFTYEDARQIWW